MGFCRRRRADTGVRFAQAEGLSRPERTISDALPDAPPARERSKLRVYGGQARGCPDRQWHAQLAGPADRQFVRILGHQPQAGPAGRHGTVDGSRPTRLEGQDGALRRRAYVARRRGRQPARQAQVGLGRGRARCDLRWHNQAQGRSQRRGHSVREVGVHSRAGGVVRIRTPAVAGFRSAPGQGPPARRAGSAFFDRRNRTRPDDGTRRHQPRHARRAADGDGRPQAHRARSQSLFFRKRGRRACVLPAGGQCGPCSTRCKNESDVDRGSLQETETPAATGPRRQGLHEAGRLG